MTDERAVSPLVVGDIPADQRAALAWRLRDALADADTHTSRHEADAGPDLLDLVRYERLRGSLLGLIVEIEGAKHQDLAAVSPRSGT